MSDLKKISFNFKVALGCSFAIAVCFLAKHDQEVEDSHRELTRGEYMAFECLRFTIFAVGTLLFIYMNYNLLNRMKIIRADKKEDESLKNFECKTQDEELNINGSKQNKYCTFYPIDKKEDKELSIDVPQENTHSEKSLTIEMPKFDSNINEKNNPMQEMNVVCADSNAQQEIGKIHNV